MKTQKRRMINGLVAVGAGALLAAAFAPAAMRCALAEGESAERIVAPALPSAPAPVGASSDVTFTRDVAPLFQKHCQECHRPGQIAPMSLLTFEEARPWAKSIRKAVAERTMPPWHAAHGLRAFANDRSLSEAEMNAITAWVDAGAPKGRDEDAPPPRPFTDSWKLGDPDLSLAMDAPFEVAAEGEDIYQCFVLDPKLAKDAWVGSVEILPGNFRMDHHLVLYVDKSKTSAKLDAADPAPGYPCFGGPGFQASMLGGWGPGMDPKVYPAGLGMKIPAGGKVVLQAHYHRTGKPETDQTRVGIKYATAPVKQVLRDGLILNFDFNIPPGDAAYAAEGNTRLMRDITIYSVQPHMHLLGRSAEMWAQMPDGSRLDLINIPKWDFGWQREYIFAEPVRVPRGARLYVRGVFDNSESNPNQPSKPPRAVTFGEETTDEMLVGVYNHTRDDENLLGSQPAPASGQ